MSPSMQEKVSGNQSLRIDVPVYLLAFIQCYTLWQFGIIYYSGQTLSILGRTPLPIEIETTSIAILLGGLASILLTRLFPRRLVRIFRVALPAALLGSLLLFFPLPDAVLEISFYLSVFVNLLLFGCCHGLVILLFTERTAMRTIAAEALTTAPFIILLQGDLFEISYTAVNALTVVVIGLIWYASWRLPDQRLPLQFVRKGERGGVPKILFAGLLFLIFMATLLMEMALSAGESTAHGTAVLYIFSLVSGLLFLLLWKGLKLSPLQIFPKFLSVMCVGFVLVMASFVFPQLRIIACAVLGLSFVVFMFISYFGQYVFRLYPSRWIVPAFPAMILLATIVHALSLELLREHLTAMYVGYAVAAAVMLVLYLQMEPFLSYHRSHTGQPLQKEVAPVPLVVGGGAVHPEEETARAEAAGLEQGAEAPEAETPPDEPCASTYPAAFQGLSPTECAVADLILRGFTFSEIAIRLNMKENAQRFHRKNVYSKLGVHSRKELFELVNEP